MAVQSLAGPTSPTSSRRSSDAAAAAEPRARPDRLAAAEPVLQRPLNTILTLVVLCLLVRDRAAARSSFLLIDAVWTGADRDACRDGRGRPPGRRLLGLRRATASTTSSTAPIRSRSAGGSTSSSRMLAVGIVWLLWLKAPRRDLGAVYFFIVFPIASFILLTGWPAIGLDAGRDRASGAACWSRSSCPIVGIVVLAAASASCWRSAGARKLPLVKLASVDLHRVRPRRAADHRAVHGQHHAAAVPARRRHPSTSCCARWSASRCSPPPTWPRWCAAACRRCRRASTRARWRSASATGR